MEENDWDLFNPPEPLNDPKTSPFAYDTHIRAADDALIEKMIEEESQPDQVMALSADETKLEIVEERKEPVKPEPAQTALFEKGEWWEEHWKGMPAFESKDLSPYKSLIVNFETREDMEKFAKLLGQTIHATTRSIWYPEATLDEVAKIRWLSNPDKLKEDKLNNKKQELIEILDGE